MIDYINYIIVYIYIILILSTLYMYGLFHASINTSMFFNIQVAVSSSKHMHTMDNGVGCKWNQRAGVGGRERQNDAIPIQIQVL